MFHYRAQLQAQDGSVVERDFAVHWDPAKVATDEVARACAAERTIASGKRADGEFKARYVGISAVLQT